MKGRTGLLPAGFCFFVASLMVTACVGDSTGGGGGPRNPLVSTAVAATLTASAQESRPTATTGVQSEWSLELTNVETSDGSCFPGSEGDALLLCQFNIRWVAAYSAGGPAWVNCFVPDIGETDVNSNTAKRVEPGAGAWEYSTQMGGFYAGLGDHEEILACELWTPDLDGRLVDWVEAPVIARLEVYRE
jgi:hypothetical protein